MSNVDDIIDAEIVTPNEDEKSLAIRDESQINDSTADPYHNLDKMIEDIADDKNVATKLSVNAIDNMRAFTIAYSRNQLSRIVKLSERLEYLEDMLFNSIKDKDVSIFTLMKVINSMQYSLDAANRTLSQVINDENLNNIIAKNINIIQNNINNYNVENKLNYKSNLNKESRKKVIAAVDIIMDKLKKIEG